MTDPHEFAGKTIEEALELAAEELAADVESIEYKLLETPKKFFFMGGSKEYRIRVLKYAPAGGGDAVSTPPPRPARAEAPPAPAERKPDHKPRPKAQPRREYTAPVATESREPRESREQGEPREPREPREQGEPREARAEAPRREHSAPAAHGPRAEGAHRAAPETAEGPGPRGQDDTYDGDDPELDRVLDLVDEFIDVWGMDLDMDVETSDDRLELNFFGDDQQYLLEKKGAGLLALQLILGKMLYKQGLIQRKLQVDCEGYRQRREHELQEIALRMAERVKKNREDAFLNPMNPYERRIVHLALVDDEKVTTESLGDGYMKKIRVRWI